MTNASLQAMKNAQKTLILGSLTALSLMLPAQALAQQPAAIAPAPAAVTPAAGSANPNCPPGSWFCAETSGQTASPAGQPVQPLTPLPPAVVYQPAPPPVVLYQPTPPVTIINARPDTPPPVYYYAPRQAAYPHRNEWGLNLHLEGAMMGSGKTRDSGMGGVGFGLRYKPVPHFGLEADLDFVGGRDYNGNSRGETAFTLNAMLFVNPKSRLQFYMVAGFGWSGARVSDDSSGYERAAQSYGYFGGQVGAGLEWRISRHFALNSDLRGFVRGRIDNDTHSNPEFYDSATGRSTNTSGGGLFTGGMTFYF